MKKYLHNYLLTLSRSGVGLDFDSVQCRYGKFTIYCLIGPEKNIVQVCFTPEKQGRVQKQLKNLNRAVTFRKQPQKKFPFDKMFADYFFGRLTKFPSATESPLIAAGTDFQKSVWRHIGAIPYGHCITYQKLAELAGSPKGSRAAAQACGANPVSVIIPCHRVVAANGLGGFAGGVVTKIALLALENVGTIEQIRRTEKLHH